MTEMCSRSSFWKYFFYLMYVNTAAELSQGATMLTTQLPLSACPKIVTRAEWGARVPKSETYLTNQPVPYAFIHHSAGEGCFDLDSCTSVVRGYQDFHMDTRGWDDIGYSFIIGGDGTIFEGRGWDRVGAHTLGFNSVGLGFCLSGNFIHFLPPNIQMDAVKQLIDYGVALGKIARNYTLRGHRDMKPTTTCPGDALYAEIRTWPHYFKTDDNARDAPNAFIDEATPSLKDDATVNGDDVTAANEVRPTSDDQAVMSEVDSTFIRNDIPRFQHDATSIINEIGFRSTVNDKAVSSVEIEAVHFTDAVRSSIEVSRISDLADHRVSAHPLSPSSHEIKNGATAPALYSPLPTLPDTRTKHTVVGSTPSSDYDANFLDNDMSSKQEDDTLIKASNFTLS